MVDQAPPKTGPIDKPPKDFFRILIVDDDEVTRKVLLAVFKKAGYDQIDEAATGDEAIEALRSTKFDLVLLDKNMPGTDGLDVLAEGKQIQQSCEFIMITAYGSMESAIRCMDLGAFSYITKPFDDINLIITRAERALGLVTIRRENDLMAERMQLLMDELERAEERLSGLEEDPGQPPEGDAAEAERVQTALGKLNKLAEQLGKLKSKAQGKAAVLFGKVEKTVSSVADLLEPRS